MQLTEEEKRLLNTAKEELNKEDSLKRMDLIQGLIDEAVKETTKQKNREKTISTMKEIKAILNKTGYKQVYTGGVNGIDDDVYISSMLEIITVSYEECPDVEVLQRHLDSESEEVTEEMIQEYIKDNESYPNEDELEEIKLTLAWEKLKDTDKND